MKYDTGGSAHITGIVIAAKGLSGKAALARVTKEEKTTRACTYC